MKTFTDEPRFSIFTSIYKKHKKSPKKIMDKELAPIMGITPETLTARKKDPGSLRVREFCKMVEYAGWTDDEILAFIRGDNDVLGRVILYGDHEEEY